MDKYKLTFQDALDELELYETSDEVSEAIHNGDFKKIHDFLFNTINKNLNESEDLDDNYNDLIWNEPVDIKRNRFIKSHNKKNRDNENQLSELLWTKDRTSYPKLGDLAILKIKIRNNINNSHKLLYDGCERRPVIIIASRGKGSYVDAVEITHSSQYNGKNLICIGKIRSNDYKDSYLNIYTIDDYKDLKTAYDFPAGFNSDNSPMTNAEYQLKFFGTIYKGDDKDEICLVHYTYADDNYLGSLYKDFTKHILEIIKKYREDQLKKLAQKEDGDKNKSK